MANLYLQIGLTNSEISYEKINLLGGPKGKELDTLKMPVLFLVGQDDTIMPPHIIKLASEYINNLKKIDTKILSKMSFQNVNAKRFPSIKLIFSTTPFTFDVISIDWRASIVDIVW